MCASRTDVEPAYDELHEQHVMQAGTDPADWAAGRERMTYDVPADLYSQMRWMEDAGLRHVDCVFKDWRFATIAGWA